MFIVLLKFSGNKAKAPDLMDSHTAWLARGFQDGVFLLAGSLKPNLGGGILAHAATRAELEHRIAEDPFVAQDIVSAEILELAPTRADARLSFLTAQLVAS